MMIRATVESFVAGDVDAQPDRCQDPGSSFADGAGEGHDRQRCAARYFSAVMCFLTIATGTRAGSSLWDSGDDLGRRLAAVQLVRITAASARQVAIVLDHHCHLLALAQGA